MILIRYHMKRFLDSLLFGLSEVGCGGALHD